MVPLRIELDGFLTHRLSGKEGTKLDFRGDWLWSITGKNGSGKSAIFDAITFVLYGEHRGGGGAQADERVMSEGRDYTRVAFDFAIGPEGFRVERTITRRHGRRKASLQKTFGAYAIDPTEPEPTRAIPLPGTDTREGLEEWVRKTVGLTYDAFTASALLRQGEADRFIMAKPRERQKILIEILDLAPYVSLELAAKRRRDRHAARRDTLLAQFGVLPEVDRADLRGALSRRRVLKLEEARLFGEWQRAQRTLSNAETFAQLQEELTRAQGRLRDMEGVLEKSETIEREASEFADLQSALPIVRDVAQRRARAAAVRAEASRKRKQAADLDVDALGAAHRRAVGELSGARSRHVAAKQRTDEARRREDALRPVAEVGRELSRLRSDRDTASEELGRLETELAKRTLADAHRQRCEQAAGCESSLRTLRSLRDDAAKAQDSLDAAQRELPARRETALSHERKLEELRRAEQTLRAELASLDRAHAELNADLRHASEELQQRREARADGTCRRCGQPVDEAHIQREIEEAARRVTECRRKASEVAKTRSECGSRSDGLAKATKELEAAHGRSQTALRELENEVALDTRARDDALRQASRVVSDLPDEYRERAADGAYPGADELRKLHLLALGVRSAREACGRLDSLAGRAAALRSQNQNRGAREAELGEQYPGVDLGAAVSAHDALLETIRSLVQQEGDCEAAFEQFEVAAANAETKLRTAEQQRQALEREAERRESSADSEDQTAAALWGGAEPAIAKYLAGDQPVDVDAQLVERVEGRVRELDGAIARRTELDEARQASRSLRDQLRLLSRHMARIPAADRVPPGDARERASGIEGQLSALSDELEQLATSITGLVARRSQIRQLREQLAGAARDHEDYAILTRQLGKDGLQAWLIQAAQESIALTANDFLGSISGGLLRLSLEPKGDDLEVLVTDYSSGQEPRDIRLVSGSQRFRVAVALALAIGQYSGSGSRRIRSVIIDEGFGSLDGDGQREIISELKALVGTLDRVILVSHQDAFHDAFPNGYFLTKADGASRAALRREGTATNSSAQALETPSGTVPQTLTVAA